MSTKHQSLKELPEGFQRSSGWLLSLGILFVFLGCLGLGMVVVLTLLSILVIGILIVIAGCSQIVDVFKSKQWKGGTLHGVIGVLYLLAGAMIIYDPILASTLITAMIAWTLIVIGFARVIMAFQLRHAKEWGWLLLAGVCAVILGILILLQWPYSALWVIGMFIAIDLIINGWSFIFIAIAIRK